MKIESTTTLGELAKLLEEEKLRIELVRYKRTESVRVWYARVLTNDVHPERLGEASASTPWDALLDALRQAKRAPRDDMPA